MDGIANGCSIARSKIRSRYVMRTDNLRRAPPFAPTLDAIIDGWMRTVLVVYTLADSARSAHCDQGSRSVAYIDFLLPDQVQQEVKRPFVSLQPDIQRQRH
jgi:hypothetical protein